MSVDQFTAFGSVVQNLHHEFQRLFYLFLPVFFILAVIIEWFKNPAGSPEFLQVLKRTFIATILVVGFREIAGTIQVLCDGVANRISDLSGIDEIIRMAGEKTSTYTMNPIFAILGFDDLFIAVLSFASYFILYLAKFVMVAIYHFMWGLLSILSPLLILFTLFRGTLSIPMHLFQSLIEVASYKIVWAILSAMITSLAFGKTYQVEGDYLTVIILNFVIALAMLSTPLVVRSIVGGGLSNLSQTLGMGAVLAIASVPRKGSQVFKQLANFPNFRRPDLNSPANFRGRTGLKEHLRRDAFQRREIGGLNQNSSKRPADPPSASKASVSPTKIEPKRP